MNEDIRIRFLWTADEILNGFRWHWRHKFRPLFRYAFWLILAAMIIRGACNVFLSGSSVAGLLPLLAGLFVLFQMRLLSPWLIRRQFAKRPDRDTEIEWRVSSDVLYARGAHGNSEFTWQALAKVVQTPAGFLFYPTEQIFHWIPRHGFSSDTDYDRLSQVAQQNAPVFYRNV
ncbi:MAG: YcxB family protein [Planctomycetota bacterium]|nr:YcxB family protein [Planctomycetota bacterium]MDA1177841.1 YcxB family protein [Planctomycetota bacterium]